MYCSNNMQKVVEATVLNRDDHVNSFTRQSSYSVGHQEGVLVCAKRALKCSQGPKLDFHMPLGGGMGNVSMCKPWNTRQ